MIANGKLNVCKLSVYGTRLCEDDREIQKEEREKCMLKKTDGHNGLV